MKTTFKKVSLLMCFMLSMMTYAQSQYSITSIETGKTLQKNNEADAVKAEIFITDSEITKGYKNLEFKLDNGISFTYEDGNYRAGYKNRSLEVKGKYSMTCEAGTLSLAFNADDGSIWWIFRQSKN